MTARDDPAERRRKAGDPEKGEMTVLVKNESGSDYRFAGHSNSKIIVAGATQLLSDDEWDSVVSSKRGPGQLNPQALPVSATVNASVTPAPAYALATRVDDVGGSPDVTYVGEADPGTATAAALWRVKRLTDDGSEFTTVEWAGTGTFDQVWDDRAS